jgi:hypothetical protein
MRPAKAAGTVYLVGAGPMGGGIWIEVRKGAASQFIRRSVIATCVCSIMCFRVNGVDAD